MRQDDINWESQLWRYISSGDGDNCPIYDYCNLRKGGHWCIVDHNEYIDDMGYVINNNLINLQRGDVFKSLRSCKIFSLVEKLAQKHLEIGEYESPPVFDSLIESIGWPDEVEVRLVPLSAYHGALWHIDDSWIIQLNKNDNHSVRRLTLFHEAFHIMAHCYSTPVFRKIDSSKGSFNELLAEYFTYNILMPENWVREKWAQVQDVNKMVEIFNVPKSAMITTLRSLSLIDSSKLPMISDLGQGNKYSIKPILEVG